MKRFVLWIIVICAALTGCVFKEDATPSRSHLVVAIDVEYSSGVITLQRHYTDPEKMRSVLNYLRLIEPKGAASGDPEQVPGSDIRILLTYSDGNEKHYRQRADQYLQEDGGIWENIDPEKGRELGLLLGLMESD